MGNQEGSQLRIACLTLKHQVHGLTGLSAAQARAGVLAAAHLGNKFAKASPLGAEGVEALQASEPRIRRMWCRL